MGKRSFCKRIQPKPMQKWRELLFWQQEIAMACWLKDELVSDLQQQLEPALDCHSVPNADGRRIRSLRKILINEYFKKCYGCSLDSSPDFINPPTHGVSRKNDGYSSVASCPACRGVAIHFQRPALIAHGLSRRYAPFHEQASLYYYFTLNKEGSNILAQIWRRVVIFVRALREAPLSEET